MIRREIESEKDREQMASDGSIGFSSTIYRYLRAQREKYQIDKNIIIIFFKWMYRCMRMCM